MTLYADLHTHSTVSDGQYTPAQLVRLAKAAGIALLALTDHDAADGAGEALEAGKAVGLRVLPGVELGAREYRNLHILGYGYSLGPSPLADLCNQMRQGREERKYRIIDFLREKGVDISLAEVDELAGEGSIGRPHFAQVMVRRGYVQTNREAFDRYLDTEEYQRIERFKADARTCAEAIKASGGRVSLAHPYQVGLPDGELAELVRQLADWGLDAIECYYPRHTPAQTAFYLELARRYGLHVTGGSDFHGERVKPDIPLTGWELETDWLLG